MINANEFLHDLETNLTQYRSNDVKEFVNNIDPAAFKVNEAKNILGLLRRKRYFKEMETAANTFIRAGENEPIFNRQLAQALIEQNDITKALSILEPLSNKVTENRVEGPEVRGLIGRSYKQLFVNEGNAQPTCRMQLMPTCQTGSSNLTVVDGRG